MHCGDQPADGSDPCGAVHDLQERLVVLVTHADTLSWRLTRYAYSSDKASADARFAVVAMTQQTVQGGTAEDHG